MTAAHQTDPFLTRIKNSIARHQMIAPGARVMAAVSGGVDSMVMLHALCRLEYPVEAAHFDHQTRDGASADDAVFVREACALLRVPYQEGSAPVEAQARKMGRSFENHARECRYAFLMDAAAKAERPVIATAHHADDQAETVLMGALGLASGFGLTGIAPVAERNGIRIVRPLLHCNRQEIESWARDKNISWREDHTNRAPQCTRNRVRLEVVPALEACNPNARVALARLADVLRVDSDYLDTLAGQALGRCVTEAADVAASYVIDRPRFREIPEALQRRIIKRLALRLSVCVTYERVVNARSFICETASGKQFDFGDGAVIESAAEQAIIRTAAQAEEIKCLSRVALNIPGETRLPGYVFQARRVPVTALPPGEARAWCGPNRQYFDADKLEGELYIRSRVPGDRMTPIGMKHTRKIQDIMVDRKIPVRSRDAVPLLLLNDVILWVAGHIRGSHAPVTEDTTTLLEVEMRHEDK